MFPTQQLTRLQILLPTQQLTPPLQTLPLLWLYIVTCQCGLAPEMSVREHAGYINIRLLLFKRTRRNDVAVLLFGSCINKAACCECVMTVGLTHTVTAPCPVSFSWPVYGSIITIVYLQINATQYLACFYY